MNTYADRLPRWTGLLDQLNSWIFIIYTILPAILSFKNPQSNIGNYPVHRGFVHRVPHGRCSTRGTLIGNSLETLYLLTWVD